MVRIATKEDKELILTLISKFLDTTEYKEVSDMNKISALVDHFLDAPKEEKIILLVDDIGILAAMVAPFIYGNARLATELVWYVEPTKRGKKAGTELLEAFEFWAKKLNCSLSTMCCLDDKVGKFYQKSGYKLYERTYIKGL